MRDRTSIGRIQVQGLTEDRFTLVADGREVLTAPSTEWANGAFVDAGPDIEVGKRFAS